VDEGMERVSKTSEEARADNNSSNNGNDVENEIKENNMEGKKRQDEMFNQDARFAIMSSTENKHLGQHCTT